MLTNNTKTHCLAKSWVQIPPLRPFPDKDLQRECNTDVTSRNPAKVFSGSGAAKSGACASGFVWHPVAAVNRAWARQAVDLGWVK